MFFPTFDAHVCRYASKKLDSKQVQHAQCRGTAEKKEMAGFHRHQNGDRCERVTEKCEALTKSKISCYTNAADMWQLFGILRQIQKARLRSVRGLGLSPLQGPRTASKVNVVGKAMI